MKNTETYLLLLNDSLFEMDKKGLMNLKPVHAIMLYVFAANAQKKLLLEDAILGDSTHEGANVVNSIENSLGVLSTRFPWIHSQCAPYLNGKEIYS